MTRATWRDPRWAATASRSSGGRAPSGERRVELCLGLVVERGLDDRAAELGDARDHLVGRALAREHEQRDEEDQADQAAPQRAACGTRGGGAAGLVQLDLAVRPAFDDDHVLEDDRLLLGQLGELAGD